MEINCRRMYHTSKRNQIFEKLNVQHKCAEEVRLDQLVKGMGVNIHTYVIMVLDSET